MNKYENKNKYTICTDVYEGNDKIKSKGTEYLPYTLGMAMEVASLDPSDVVCGKKRYEYYLDRAIFYNYFATTIETAVGIIASDGFDALTVPEVIDIDSLNMDNENIYQINANINMEQCITGRTGLLVDPKSNGINLIQYYANSIIDYKYEISGGEKLLTDLLLKQVDDSYLYLFVNEDGIYSSKIIKDDVDSIVNAKDATGSVIEPKLNGRTFNKIPFVFINAYNLKIDPSDPPFYDLANLCLDIYKNSADYQQYLFESSQNTLVLSGFDKSDFPDGVRIGSGSAIFGNLESKAYYVGIDASGLNAMHDSLKELKETAKNTSIDIVSTAKGESGVALETKIYIKSNSVRLIANVGAKGIENALRLALEWYGIEADIEVKGNSKFNSASISIDNLIKLLDNQAIDLEQVHQYLFKIGVVDKEKMISN